MRLTLRTMLAYLDDILEPGDAQDLGRKIEESEFASSLVGRIRDVSRRLRLGAPKLTGRGMGLDPNTVAEYLDNTLAVARVPDFEKICLESDMHLAEVACSHQILALVLGGPAEVNPATRQRMYKLVARPEEATFSVAPAAPARPEPLYTPPRRKRTVPDYLRDDRPRFAGWLKGVAAVLVLAGLGVAVLLAVGPFGRPAQVAQAPGAAAPDAPLTVVPAVPAPPAESSPEPGPADESPDEAGAGEPLGNEPAAEASPAAGEAEVDAAPAQSEAALPADESLTSDIPPATADDSEPPAEEAPAAESAADAAPPEVGQYTSTGSVLLGWQEERPGWMRLASQSPLRAGEPLLSLPLFRSTIELNGGVTIEVVGETQVRLLAPAAADVPGVEIGYGQLVLVSSGRPGAQLSIVVGELRGTLTLADAAAVVGVEVRPVRAEGTDPETEPPAPNLDLYVASGQVVWMDASRAAPETLTGPQHWSFPAPVTDETAAQIPGWVLETEGIAAIDRKAAEFVAENFALDRPAQLELKQLAEHRRSEVRSLAVNCLAAIGNYDALVKSLNDDTSRSSWKQQVDELRRALAHGPEAAARVRASIERQRGPRGAQLYRMLWGYNDQQLRSGSAAELVECLNDDKNLDVRVVAFCTLERIAGKGLAYRPADNPKQRQPHLQKWRQWAEAYQGAPGAGARPMLP
ncbi:MAG: hypothetical protein JNG90_17335 [Planctomycetaceae bacterium]|nr:hypothetical protein [Planctomycetaceae bacterium]